MTHLSRWCSLLPAVESLWKPSFAQRPHTHSWWCALRHSSHTMSLPSCASRDNQLQTESSFGIRRHAAHMHDIVRAAISTKKHCSILPPQARISRQTTFTGLFAPDAIRVFYIPAFSVSHLPLALSHRTCVLLLIPHFIFGNLVGVRYNKNFNLNASLPNLPPTCMICLVFHATPVIICSVCHVCTRAIDTIVPDTNFPSRSLPTKYSSCVM